MSKYDYDLIVIGGGAAGLTASTFAGQSAAKTLLVEKEEKLGGDCLHYGCVPSKSLIKSAYAHHILKGAEKYGLPKLDIPPVDFDKITARIREIIATIQKQDEPDYLAEQYNVETQFGAARFTDAHTIILKDKKMTSRFFVLATGSSPSIPPVEGLAEIPYLTNTNIFQLSKLPASMIILGGGPIGMEMAQAFQRLGTQVTVVEFLPRILAREDADISAFAEEFCAAEGILFHLETKAIRAQKGGGGIRLTVEKEGRSFDLEAETLLVATGRTPNSSGLDLEKAGVLCAPQGLPVNNKMQTNIPHIYACGDLTGQYPFTHVASQEAVTAIMNAILKIPQKMDYTKIPWCTYLDPEIASIGYNETRAKEAGLAYTLQKMSLAHNDRALAEGENRGFIKLLLNKKGMPIGAQIIAPHAGELIAEWIPVLNKRLKLSAVTGAVHPYPTLAEINKNAGLAYVVSTIPAWTKKLTKFFFRYQGKA